MWYSREPNTTQVTGRHLETAQGRYPKRDRGIFFAFFVAGLIAILALKALVDSQIVVTAVPCGLMIFYALILWDFTESRPRYDGTGDNLYYLGFLYTLTSLGYSLYRFSADEEDTEIIVTNFGIAIATTILGMALRILVARPVVDDPAVIEGDARVELATAARKLRAELVNAVATFGESLEVELREVRRQGNSFSTQLEEDLDGFRKRLSEESDKVGETCSKATRQIDSASGALEQAKNKAVEAVHSLTGSVQEFTESTAALKSFTHHVSGLDSRLVGAIEAAERYPGALEAGAEAIRDSLQREADRIRSVDFRRVLEGAIEPPSNELRAAAEEFRKLLESMRQADEFRKQAVLRSEEATAALQELVARLRELAGLFDGTPSGEDVRDLAQSLNTTAATLSSVGERASATVGKFATVGSELTRLTKTIRNANHSLSGIAPKRACTRPSNSIRDVLARLRNLFSR